MGIGASNSVGIDMGTDVGIGVGMDVENGVVSGRSCFWTVAK